MLHRSKAFVEADSWVINDDTHLKFKERWYAPSQCNSSETLVLHLFTLMPSEMVQIAGLEMKMNCAHVICKYLYCNLDSIVGKLIGICVFGLICYLGRTCIV